VDRDDVVALVRLGVVGGLVLGGAAVLGAAWRVFTIISGVG